MFSNSSTNYKQGYQLAKEFCELIDGTLHTNEAVPFTTVIKEDILFHIYYYSDQKYPHCFSFTSPLHLTGDIFIEITRPKILPLTKKYYECKEFQMTINKDAKKIADGLLNDYEFMNRFKESFHFDYTIEITQDSMTIYDFRPIESTFATEGTLTKEKLLKMMNVLKEVRDALNYVIKKTND